jgi:hypothetical protein
VCETCDIMNNLVVFGLFNDALRSSGYTAWNDWMSLKELRKTTKSLSQGSRPPDLELNPGPPEYEAEMLTSQPRRSVSDETR